MGALSFLGMGTFVVVSLAVGGRLLLRSLASRELADRTLGATLFFAGGLGPAAVTAAGVVRDAQPGASALLWAGGLLLVCVGASALCVFTHRVFHRGGRAAGIGAALLIALMFGGLAGQGLVTGFGRIGLHDAFAWISFAARAASFAWASWASLREYRAGLRRQRLGLADPLVTNRFLLWSVGSGAAFLAFLVNLSRNLAGEFDPTSAIALTATPALGLVGAAAIVLTFFPPAAYRRRFASAS